jgi:hypothetical protein
LFFRYSNARGNGLQLLKNIFESIPFEIIFTTAHEYAIDAIVKIVP